MCVYKEGEIWWYEFTIAGESQNRDLIARLLLDS